MTSDEELATVLNRHSDAVAVEHRPGSPTLVYRDRLLIDRDDATAVDPPARWIDREANAGSARVLKLRPGVDPCGLATELNAGAGRPVAAPLHLVHAQPIWFSGPAGAPRPSRPVPAPVPAHTARRVTIAVPDTGLCAHPWWVSTDWYADQRDDVAEILDADRDGRLDPAAGHGTFIAGELLRLAPGARLRCPRVIGSDGVGDELAVLGALDALAAWSTRTGTPVDVLGFSSGYFSFDDGPPPALAAALRRLAPATVVVACAGNHGGDRPMWPAALPEVIGVAALDAAGERAAFSGYGDWVDACARGVDLTSSFATFHGPARDFNGYAVWSGTSFAAPRVAGAIAGAAARDGVAADTAAHELLDRTRHRALQGLGTIVDPAVRTPVGTATRAR